MPQPVNLIIRDAVPGDLPACLALDHHYETDHVWQMHLHQDDGYAIQFRSERLPRTLELNRAPAQAHLEAALAPERCFLAAANRNDGEVLGYLSMQRDPQAPIGHIVDFAVERAVRRCGIGSRLLHVASSWAKERQIVRMQLCIETTNHPAIAFATARGFAFCGFNDRYLPNRDIALYFSQAVR